MLTRRQQHLYYRAREGEELLRNLMELLETVSKSNEPGHEVAVHVLTAEDEFSADKQADNFQKMAEACSGIGIAFTWEFDQSGKKHDRDITTDTGWKIVLSRALDVFQRYELNEAFSLHHSLSISLTTALALPLSALAWSYMRSDYDRVSWRVRYSISVRLKASVFSARCLRHVSQHRMTLSPFAGSSKAGYWQYSMTPRVTQPQPIP